jgi:parallel beta-helix repeat protein
VGKAKGRGHGRNNGDTTTVVIGDTIPNVVAVVLSPDAAQLEPSQSRHFSAEGKLSDGSTAQIGTVWTADGGTIGAGGDYIAGTTPGRYHVVATNVSGTLADTAVVDIAAGTPAPTLTALELTPATVTLSAGGSRQFTASGRMSDGSAASIGAQFSATGGSITASGLYVAGTAPGTYRVIATSPDGPADTSAVTVAAAFTGTVIQPGMDIQAAVDANPPGTAFLLKAGVHRMQQIDPKSGNVFAGEPGTILSGARRLTDFTRSGAYWVASGQSQQGRSTDPVHCEPGYEGCQWPEDLFLDDRLLLRVTSLAQVAPGKWYFDYATDRIYLGDDPAGRQVETSVSAYAFGGNADNVTLRQLVIEKYASPAQAGAIHGDGTTGWRVEDCEVRQSHGIGIRIGDAWIVRNCRVHANGQLGLARGGTGSLIEGCEIYGNKTVPFKTGFAGGALKFSKSRNLVFQNNRVHDNMGNGVWLDIDNIDYQVRDNVVYNNASQGIFVEISYRGKVYNNKVYGNGFGRNSSWLYGAGILIAASPDVEVYGNEVTNNANGIAAIQQNRGSGAYGPHQISNLYVHDNVITMTEGKTGLAQSIGDDSYFTNRNNRWVRNSYTLGRNANYFAWLGGAVSETQWRQAGQDVDGTFRR